MAAGASWSVLQVEGLDPKWQGAIIAAVWIAAVVPGSVLERVSLRAVDKLPGGK